MELLHNLQIGIGLGFTGAWHNAGFVAFGVMLGMLAGLLPGIGLLAALAMMLPAVHALDASAALVMLTGICVGAQYGGSISAILLEASGAPSAAAAADGLAMTRQGRAAAALGVVNLGSFAAACIGVFVVALLSPPLTALAFSFGPAEYFSLTVLGLIGAVVLASGSLLKAIGMILFGLLLGQIGPIDAAVAESATRFTAGAPELAEGIGFIVIAIGTFGIGYVIANLDEWNSRVTHRSGNQAGAAIESPTGRSSDVDVRGPLPSRQDFTDAWPAVARGTALGSLLGMLPGGGAWLASFAAYSLEKTLPRREVEQPFGKGNLRGVAGPDAANHAGAQSAFVPMLALGIPPNAAMALIVGAMTVKNIVPGPQVMTSHPDLFWSLIASMWIGNLLLVLLNLPLRSVWVRLLEVPYRLVFPAFVLFCCIGAYALHGRVFDVYMVAGFGVVGYLLTKLSLDASPLVLGYILGPMLEENLRSSLQLTGGDWSAFVTRPVSAALLAAAALMIVVVMLPSISKRREATFQED